MSAPCPFCGFEVSDYRESYNWRCNRCGKDYGDWLTAQKAKEENVVKKEPLFSRQEVPPEAEPVKLAQHLFLLAILLVLALNFVIEGMSSWLFPISIPFAAYSLVSDRIYSRFSCLSDPMSFSSNPESVSS